MDTPNAQNTSPAPTATATTTTVTTPAPERGNGHDQTLDVNSPQIRAMIDKAVADATSGIVKNRDEVLSEKKRLQDEYQKMQKTWEGLNPDQVRQVMDQFSKEEERKMLAEGKLDEVVQRRFQAFITREQKQREAAEQIANQARDEAAKLKSQWHREKLYNSVARHVSGTVDGALSRIQREVEAEGWFKVDDEGRITTTEHTPLGKDGKPITMDTLNDYLLATTPFYFPASSGGGAMPSSGVSTAGLKRSIMSDKEKAAFIHAHGREAYEKIPWN